MASTSVGQVQSGGAGVPCGVEYKQTLKNSDKINIGEHSVALFIASQNSIQNLKLEPIFEILHSAPVFTLRSLISLLR